MFNPTWSVTNYGAQLHINDYNFPSGTICAIDVETNGKAFGSSDFKIVCVGVTTDGINIFVYFDPTHQLYAWLSQMLLVAHDGKSAEIPWLEKEGIKVEQLYFDTKTGYYVYDSARKNYALKPILKDVFNIEYPTYDEVISNKEFIKMTCDVHPEYMIQKKKGLVLPRELTLDKMDQQVVAEYNASDVMWTFQLWVWLRTHFTGRQWNFFNNIEMPETRLLYLMEKQGIKIDTQGLVMLHKEYRKKALKSKREFLDLVKQYE